jgi:hypothetical protein
VRTLRSCVCLLGVCYRSLCAMPMLWGCMCSGQRAAAAGLDVFDADSCDNQILGQVQRQRITGGILCQQHPLQQSGLPAVGMLAVLWLGSHGFIGSGCRTLATAVRLQHDDSVCCCRCGRPRTPACVALFDVRLCASAVSTSQSVLALASVSVYFSKCACLTVSRTACPAAVGQFGVS